MGFFKKLFSGSPRPSSDLYNFSVKCNRCGEVIEGHVNLSNDLSAEYEDDRESYFVRKVLVGGGTCFQQVEVELRFDPNKLLIDKQIHGGQFVED